ncbi:MAG TPA: PilN domain-containing protein [Thermodesulfobacteriota bacterium]|nr:PilN domain-containing protein [Deltaproteobacteria bacterium]HNR12488.1 PilN domain-containing protein [Thermodesulfobacteriota bacterium]HNU70115.1 PilN domain-containing protein [Thermodesulfobacteriota bacterium]HQO77483.1 PilN domain-containing protein [Thermodesulfobacteriota bacterium]
MIKINLLPKKEITQWVALAEQGILALLIIVIVILGLTGWTIYVRSQVKDLERRIQVTKTELEKLQKDEAKIEEMKRTEGTIQRKIDVIKQLEKRKTGPAMMLDAVSSNIPEKLWLTELRTQGAHLTLTGVAIDNETIASLMTNLEDARQFDAIELIVSKEKKIEDYMFKEFTLTCDVKIMKEMIAASSGGAATAARKGKDKRSKASSKRKRK